jgi:DNA-directed RNA polymerase specialized sigma24 family protein
MAMSSAFSGRLVSEEAHRRAVASGLARPEVREGLVSFVRRVVARDDVPDLVQTVLCEALASPRSPTEPEELARWVRAIAKHKVVDYRRRTGRLVLDPDVGDAPAAAETPPVDQRRALDEVLAEAATSRDRETLDWMVREHQGEALCAIAEEVGLTSPAVRKRVSRLRQALRSRLAWAVALIALVALGLVSARSLWPESARPDIARDAPSEVSSLHGAGVSGEFRIASVELPPSLSEKAASTTRAWTTGATVRITRDRVTLSSHGRSVDLAVSHVVRSNDRTRCVLRLPSGHAIDVTLVEGPGRLDVTAQSGAMIGRAVLLR